MARSPGRPTAEAATVILLALGFGAWAAVASRWLHPHLTRNADEATYLQQGAVLASGHLTAAPPGDLRAFQPWFATVRDGRYVFKYTLVWPGVLAFGRVLGTPRVGGFLAAAAAVVGVYLLAREILGSHRRGLAATVLVMVAPLVAFDATTFLPYVWFSALWTFTAWAVLRAARSRHPGFALAAGALAGLTFFARPYEALFVLAPFGVWLLWDGRREVGALARRVGWIVVGTVVPLAVFAVTNDALTGSPVRTTLTAWDPLDRPGFGPRRILGTGPPQIDFTVRDGIVGLAKHTVHLQWWSAGGVVLAALAVGGLVVGWRRRGVVPLAAVVVTLALGLVAYWGPYSTASLWPDFARSLGPFYLMPMLVPLAILAVEGLAALRSRAPAFAVVAVVLLVAITGVNTGRALDLNLDVRRARDRHFEALDGVDRSRRVLVFVPSWSDYLGTGPNGALVNTRSNPRVLYANASTPEAEQAVIAAFPDRIPYRLVRDGRTTTLTEVTRR